MEFIFKRELNEELKIYIENLIKADEVLTFTILILRGVYSYNILASILYKRWRVDYGVNENHEQQIL